MKSMLCATALMLAAALAGCQTNDTAGPPAIRAHANMWEKIDRAVAVLRPAPNANVQGTIYFTESDRGVVIEGYVMGLKPNSEHGFHIHQYGDLTNADFTSAGGHYNPDNAPHAGLNAEPSHAGDLGNIKANARGVARINIIAYGITVADIKNPIIGRSIVVHAGRDDLSSQPTGDSGDRIAAGVIGVANPGTRVSGTPDPGN